MGTRATTIFNRLQRLIPPPDAVGWHHTRLLMEAAAIGEDPNNFDEPTQDDQANRAEAQLILGAFLARDDGAPTDWDLDRSTQWHFAPTADSIDSSGDYFLDVWGRLLVIGRVEGETDADYALRIIAELSTPTITNYGLAKAIDRALGVNGTEVLDAEEALTMYRLNDGFQLNNDVPLNSTGANESLVCCFVVRTPASISVADRPKVIQFINDRKAAGTRLISLIPDYSPQP